MKQTVGNVTDSDLHNVNMHVVENGQPRHIVWLWVISLLALFCAIIALIVCACSGFNGVFNLGIVVAILSFLLMILLGWNIFYALGIKDDVRATSTSLQNDLASLRKDLENVQDKQDKLISELIVTALKNNNSTPIINAVEQSDRVAEALRNRKQSNG